MDRQTDALQDLRERVSASPFHATLGIDVVEAAEGRVRLAVDTTDAQKNLLGTIHGGVVATLADTAMGFAVRTAIDAGRPHVTIDLSVRFLRPASPGRIEAVGTVVRAGSQIAFADADVVAADGTLLARASGTYSVAAR
ncbi:MAG TPA: PaaI family thioesterase [Actinomycetota bacterium]|nr:PaaI family thioesterase [Actinomycetota bacterium]